LTQPGATAKGEVDEHHLFTVTLPTGVLGLSLRSKVPAGKRSASRRSLNAAHALSRIEVALCALEDWLGVGLAPELSLATPAEAQQMFAEHLLVQNPKLQMDVLIPHAQLSALRMGPSAGMLDWVWPPVNCEVVIDAMPLSPTDVRQMASGAMLLLPASFSTEWNARLQPLVAGMAPVAARISSRDNQLSVTSLAAVAPAVGPHVVRVSMTHPLAVAPSDLFAWIGMNVFSSRPSFALPGRAALFAGGTPGAIAVGELVPMSTGYGVRLDQVAERAEALLAAAA
jgi:hypothetical protein